MLHPEVHNHTTIVFLYPLPVDKVNYPETTPLRPDKTSALIVISLI